MKQFWNVEKFRDNHPDNYDDLGNQYIQLIIKNVELILDHFNQDKFLNSLAQLTEIYAPSYLYQAQELADSLEALQGFLNEFMEIDDQTIRTKQSFDFEKQRLAAQCLLQIVDAALNTIKDWNEFRNQQMDMNIFKIKVDLLIGKFDLRPPICNCSCQLI